MKQKPTSLSESCMTDIFPTTELYQKGSPHYPDVETCCVLPTFPDFMHHVLKIVMLINTNSALAWYWEEIVRCLYSGEEVGYRCTSPTCEISRSSTRSVAENNTMALE